MRMDVALEVSHELPRFLHPFIFCQSIISSLDNGTLALVDPHLFTTMEIVGITLLFETTHFPPFSRHFGVWYGYHATDNDQATSELDYTIEYLPSTVCWLSQFRVVVW